MPWSEVTDINRVGYSRSLNVRWWVYFIYPESPIGSWLVGVLWKQTQPLHVWDSDVQLDVRQNFSYYHHCYASLGPPLPSSTPMFQQLQRAFNTLQMTYIISGSSLLRFIFFCIEQQSLQFKEISLNIFYAIQKYLERVSQLELYVM